MTDIDECAGIDESTGDALNGGCHHICVNTPASFHCACNPGYTGIGSDSVQCEGMLQAKFASGLNLANQKTYGACWCRH